MIKYPCRVVPAGGTVKGQFGDFYAEDACIVDAEGREVLGCSEWLRGAEHLPRIVACLNACQAIPDNELSHGPVMSASNRSHLVHEREELVTAIERSALLGILPASGVSQL